MLYPTKNDEGRTMAELTEYIMLIFIDATGPVRTGTGPDRSGPRSGPEIFRPVRSAVRSGPDRSGPVRINFVILGIQICFSICNTGRCLSKGQSRPEGGFCQKVPIFRKFSVYYGKNKKYITCSAYNGHLHAYNTY